MSDQMWICPGKLDGCKDSCRFLEPHRYDEFDCRKGTFCPSCIPYIPVPEPVVKTEGLLLDKIVFKSYPLVHYLKKGLVAEYWTLNNTEAKRLTKYVTEYFETQKSLDDKRVEKLFDILDRELLMCRPTSGDSALIHMEYIVKKLKQEYIK